MVTRIGGIVAGLCLALAAEAASTQTVRPEPRPRSGSAESIAGSRALTVSAKPPLPRPPGLMAGHEFRVALVAARKGQWTRAKRAAARIGQVAVDIIEWKRLRTEGEGAFADYRAFLEQNDDWPDLNLIRERGEAKIPRMAADSQVIAYFSNQGPQTGHGVLRFADALKSAGQETKADEELIRAWTSMSMSARDERTMRSAHAKLLKPYHAERLDFALWQEDIAAARRMLPLAGADWEDLAKARLALQRSAGGVDELIAAVPDHLAGDPGLAHDRALWRFSKRRHEDAADLILTQSANAKALGRPQAWAYMRSFLAREAMQAGNGRRAYDLARNHYLEQGEDYADLEWLAGYIALRYLDRPGDALFHFRRFSAAANSPISLGRAGYWEGRALEKMGWRQHAMEAYRKAAKHQTSFYGLLAAEKVGATMDPAITGRIGADAQRRTEIENSRAVQAAGLLYWAGEHEDAEHFFSHLAATLPEEYLVPLGDYALRLGDPHMAVKVGKQIARRGVVAIRAYFPLKDLGSGELPVPEALALSIARRESEFNNTVVSGAGARGLMQLLPTTARQMARRAGLPYVRGRLTRDAAYNARLGSFYLDHLIKRLGNNIVLVSASYNAGPSRARRWIKERGDPRARNVDVIDWIEHIPFRETRNYVMRVAESLPVYRARLTGETAPIRLSLELKAK